MDPVELACLRLAIGEQPSEDLPGIAADALVRGLDSPYLRRAAGASSSDVRDARDLFVIALEELGYAAPGEQESLWRLTRDAAEKIVSGEIEAYEGARQIWTWRYRFEREGDLRIFVGLASEWEGDPPRRPVYERQIREAARMLLSRDDPRRWVKVMARYSEGPLSLPGREQRIDAIEPTELPISTKVASDLGSWAADFDAAMNRTVPPSSLFASQAEAEDFVERGVRLVGQLQAELGDEWHVEYMPTPTRAPGMILRD